MFFNTLLIIILIVKKLIVLLLLILPLSCSKKEPLKIAFISSISGELSSLGVETRNAIEIYIDRVNSQGGINGRSIELLIYDDKNSIPDSRVITNQILEAGIKFIISAQTSAHGEQLLWLIKDKPVLAISPTMSSSKLSNIDDNFIRICPTNLNQGEVLSELLKEHNKENLLIISDNKNRAYSKDLSSFVMNDFLTSNRICKTMGYTKVDTIFIQNILRDIESDNFDSILFITSGQDLSVISQQLLKNSVDIDLYSGAWGMTRDLITRGGKSVEGLFIIYESSRDSEDPLYKEFKGNYYNKYGNLPSQISTRSYESIRLLITSIEKAKVDKPELVKKEILSMESIHGILQDYKINSYGDTFIPHNLYRVENGQFIEIK